MNFNFHVTCTVKIVNQGQKGQINRTTWNKEQKKQKQKAAGQSVSKLKCALSALAQAGILRAEHRVARTCIIKKSMATKNVHVCVCVLKRCQNILFLTSGLRSTLGREAQTFLNVSLNINSEVTLVSNTDVTYF